MSHCHKQWGNIPTLIAHVTLHNRVLYERGFLRTFAPTATPTLLFELAICTFPIIHLAYLRPPPPNFPEFFITFVFHFSWVLQSSKRNWGRCLCKIFLEGRGGGGGETRGIIEDERKQAFNLTWFQSKQSLETQQYWQNRVLYHSERLQLHLLVDFWVMHAVWSSHHLFLHPRLLLVRIDHA